jgi:hypothetical protein
VKEGNYCKREETDWGYDRWIGQLEDTVCHSLTSHVFHSSASHML